MSAFFVSAITVGLLLSLCFVTVKSHATACNHGNDVTCLYGNATYKGVRQLMNNTEYFWFGTGHNESCSPGDAIALRQVECINPAPHLHSIIQRLRSSPDSDTSGIDHLLKVHYSVNQSQYQGCHSLISVPVTDEHIDPVHIVYTDAWALNHQPNVSWQGETSTQTTLVFWDAGWFQLQGLWINCTGGSLQDGTEVIPYSGPMNPVARKNPVVFALFRQSREVTRRQAFDAVMKLTRITVLGTLEIKMNELMDELGLTGPMAVSIISSSVDTYSAQYGIDQNIINSCPVLRTSVMQSEQEYFPWNTTEVQLSVSVDIIYFSPPITFESCCQQISMKLQMFYVDSRARLLLNSAVVRNVPYYITLVPIHIRDEPHFFSHPSRWFTLLMLDTTDSAPNVSDRALVHWQVINVHDTHVKTGDTTMPYKPPHIPVPSPERRYVFLLLEQSARLTAQAANYTAPGCDHNTELCIFDLHRFKREQNVRIVGLSEFRAISDDYSRQKLYNERGYHKAAACVGVSAFRDPCPSDTTCTDGAGVLSLPSLFALLLLGVFVSLRP